MVSSVPARRITRVVATALALLAALAMVATAQTGPAGAQPAHHSSSRYAPDLAAGASLAHPYSAPVWWPLGAAPAGIGNGQSVEIGCYKANPGCPVPHYHSTWLLDILGRSGTDSPHNHQVVYAMGAGVVHIGASGHTCAHDGPRGNYLTIYHGGGVTSYYGHLSPHMLVRNGEYVSARTPIGYLDNTGDKNCATYHGTRYTYIAVKRGRDYVDVKHLFACVGGHRETWPQDIDGGRYRQFNDMPFNTPVPDADSRRTCAAVPPTTAPRPSGTHLGRTGHTKLRARWTPASRGYHVRVARVTLEIYYSADHAWYLYREHDKTGAANSTKFTHLKWHHHYRMRVEFANPSGYSGASPYHYRSTARHHH